MSTSTDAGSVDGLGASIRCVNIATFGRDSSAYEEGAYRSRLVGSGTRISAWGGARPTALQQLVVSNLKASCWSLTREGQGRGQQVTPEGALTRCRFRSRSSPEI